LASCFFVSFLEKQKRKEARVRRWEVAKQKAFMATSISFIHPQPLAESNTAVTLFLFRNRKTGRKKTYRIKNIHFVDIPIAVG